MVCWDTGLQNTGRYSNSIYLAMRYDGNFGFRTKQSRERNALSVRWNLELSADMNRDLGRIVVYKVADAVMRDAAELGPLAESANRRLAISRENAAGAETDDVGEL